MKVLSTQVNHIRHRYYFTDEDSHVDICKCPAHAVWEIHNIVLEKHAGGFSTFDYLQIIRNGVAHYLEGLIHVIVATKTMNTCKKIVYMKPGDVLRFTFRTWGNDFDVSISYGVVEHRDP